MKKNLVILSGAGISAESGIKTFRDAGGLWEGHDVMEVASFDGWLRNPELVMDFYNQRRRQLHQVSPNAGHFAIAALEEEFNVQLITQNVDNLHEKAGSTNVLHLHGELLKARSTTNPGYIVDWEHDLHFGDTDNAGNQLRPHIVWFGEEIPLLEDAVEITQKADIFIVVGTSLQVYPAAGLIQFTNRHVPVFYIDPNPAPILNLPNPITVIAEPASVGMPILAQKLNQLK
ncbi:MAG: NAD-dependent deacylase [Flavobacterium sp.]|nr:NAD-dependent deacylase [Flavobacterium sp.]